MFSNNSIAAGNYNHRRGIGGKTGDMRNKLVKKDNSLRIFPIDSFVEPIISKEIIFSGKACARVFLYIIHACVNLLFLGKMDLFD